MGNNTPPSVLKKTLASLKDTGAKTWRFIKEMGPQTWRATKNLAARTRDFAKAVWNDHDFWIHAIAFKAGAGSIAAMAILFSSSIVAMPFLLTVGTIVAGVSLAVMLLYGAAAGGGLAWAALKKHYRRHIGGDFSEAAHAPIKPLHQHILEKPRVQKIINSPLVQKFLQSKTWKTTKSITQKQRHNFLAGLAGSGSLAQGIVSAGMLITQIMLVPVVAVGGWLTITTAVAVGGIISAGYGIYLAAQSFIKKYKDRKNKDQIPLPESTTEKKILPKICLPPFFQKKKKTRPEAIKPEIKATEEKGLTPS